MQRIGHRYSDAESGETVDTWFPRANKSVARNCLAAKLGLTVGDFVEVEIADLEAPAKSQEEMLLRLHLLSECAVKPNGLNLDGLYDLLPNIAWTSAGPVLANRVDALREQLATEVHHLAVYAIDKLPRMVDYVVPEGVRIGDADRVRLGAHLWPGTTVGAVGAVSSAGVNWGGLNTALHAAD